MFASKLLFSSGRADGSREVGGVGNPNPCGRSVRGDRLERILNLSTLPPSALSYVKSAQVSIKKIMKGLRAEGHSNTRHLPSVRTVFQRERTSMMPIDSIDSVESK